MAAPLHPSYTHNTGNGKAGTPSGKPLCRELLQKFPKGKCARRAEELLGQENVSIEPPAAPIAGKVNPGPGARSVTVTRYEGPEFVIVS